LPESDEIAYGYRVRYPARRPPPTILVLEETRPPDLIEPQGDAFAFAEIDLGLLGPGLDDDTGEFRQLARRGQEPAEPCAIGAQNLVSLGTMIAMAPVIGPQGLAYRVLGARYN